MRTKWGILRKIREELEEKKGQESQQRKDFKDEVISSDQEDSVNLSGNSFIVEAEAALLQVEKRMWSEEWEIVREDNSFKKCGCERKERKWSSS